MRSKLILAALLCAGLATPVAAQIEVTPFFGATIPMRSLLLDTAGAAGFRTQAHRIYGVKFAKPMSPTLGLELALGAGNGEFEIVSTENFRLGSSIYFADLRANLRVAGNDDARLGVIAGAGWTQYTSGIFDAAHEGDDETQWAGTVTGMIGLGVKAKLGGRVMLSVDAIDRIHEHGIESSGFGGLTEVLQHDLTFSAGLSFPLGN